MSTWLVVGGVTATTVRAWLRAPGEDHVAVRLCVGGSLIAEGTIEPSRDHDGIGVVDLAVPPGHEGERATLEAAGQSREFTLAPREDAREAFRFWFASCHQPFDASDSLQMRDSDRADIYPVARNLVERADARFGLQLGDQIYADELPFVDVRAWATDHPDMPDEDLIEAYRQLYRGYFNEPGIRALQEACPSFLIWDDHEVFNSWGSHLDVSDTDVRIQRAAIQAYREYQHCRNPGTTIDDVAPYHYQFWYASTGFFVFDLRGERDYRVPRVVGEQQWLAFARFLAEAADRDVRTVFIAASIPTVHFPPSLVRLLDNLPGRHGTNVRDRWDATEIAHERDRLMDLICDWQAAVPGRHAIVLSGDVHSGAAFSIARTSADGGRLEQWTSSSMSSPAGPVHAIGNELVTRAVNVGERHFRAKRLGIEPRNNMALVAVRPRENGPGHRVSLAVYGFWRGKRQLRRSIDVTLP